MAGDLTMKKVELNVYRDRLMELRARLRGDVDQMANSALKKTRSESNGDLSSMPIHMADIGSDNFEQEFTLSLMENEEGTLDAIEVALERIGAGTFGCCEECGVKIPKARLNAIPYAVLCVKCAEHQENHV
jgi:RNA polymerase-binding protein DksA